MKRKHKKFTTVLAVLLALLVALPGTTALAYAAEPAAMTFQNASDDGADKISMTDQRSFTVTLELPGTGLEAAQEMAKRVTWSLTRAKGMQDEKLYPYQYLGGPLATEWRCWESTEPFLKAGEVKAEAVGSGSRLTMTLKNNLFFPGSVSVTSGRNVFPDYIGDFRLNCLDGEKTIGSVTVRVNPYDSYRTMGEIYGELKEAAVAANRAGMYAEVKLMGKSSGDRDMPYIIIADSKDTVTKYQSVMERAEKDPEAVLAEVKAGTLDYKIPILYNNIHPDENPGTDAPMNFMWRLAKGETITYDQLAGFTEEGQKQMEAELSQYNIKTSVLIKDWATRLGQITAGNEDEDGNPISGLVDLEKYYKIEKKQLAVKDLLKEAFFILVPEENVDGRTYNNRQNHNGFDINRDNLFQTQKETQNMAALIAEWNPAALVELHGYVAAFQLEPCSPPHEPNFEYDLIAEQGVKAGEAFGTAAVANNEQFNSYVMPLRDYMNPTWKEPWDDMSTNYTPQYAMLHGSVSYTIEVPKSNEEATKSLEYGLVGHAAYVMENSGIMQQNQLETFVRGVKNIDADSVRPWYVDVNDSPGKEADVYRPKGENGKFFPEYYVIPLDAENQVNPAAAYEMQEIFLRNDVKLSTLKEDVKSGGDTYKAGSLVVDMHQAKRNVANALMYDGALITTWPDLYSEPVTAFGKLRGFDYDDVRTADIFKGKLSDLTVAQKGKTTLTGTGTKVIIKNNSVDAIQAVNRLLGAGKAVGMIMAGDYKGSFAVSMNDFNTVKDQYLLVAMAVDIMPEARFIGKPTLYINGGQAEFAADKAGDSYGVRDYNNMRNTNYNFDRFAFGQQMGFSITDDPAKADVIVGNRALDDKAAAAVKVGTPYVAAGPAALEGIKSKLLSGSGFDYVSTGTNQDILYRVNYAKDHLTTSTYVAEGDDVMYGYGGAYISKLPEGSAILATAATGKDAAISGFIKEESLKQFLGSVQGFEYEAKGLNLTVFANSLTNKAHQQDEYQLLANAIYGYSMAGTMTEGGFMDVRENDWFAPAVKFVVGENLFSGTSSGKFSPEDNMTRGMIVTVLHKLAGKPDAAGAPFKDVAASAWYEDAVNWAAEKNIFSGAGVGRFAPDDYVTREQMALVFYKYAKEKKLDVTAKGDLTVFKDAASASPWAREALEWATGSGLFAGKGGGMLDPSGNTTRAEVAAIFQNFVVKMEKAQ